MECNFVVGQKVVCINDDANSYQANRPGLIVYPSGLDGLKKGETYTVKRIYMNEVTLRIDIEVEEITRPIIGTQMGRVIAHIPGFYYRRFAPIKEKKTNIAIFNEILNKVNDGNHDNDYDFCLDELYEMVEK